VFEFKKAQQYSSIVEYIN